MSKWFSSLKKNSENEGSNTTSTNSIPSSLVSDLDNLNIIEERLKRYADEADTDTTFIDNTKDEAKLRARAILLREKAVSKTLNNIKLSMKVDLCFVLDCSGSMKPHIDAAKDCILQVSNYIKNTNPTIKLRVGFCGYRDFSNKDRRLQIFDFTDQYENFTNYLRYHVVAIFNDDEPEDVLGGLDAAVNKLDWQNTTRVLLHIGDYPPHGRRFTDLRDKYPDGDPNGLTPEIILKEMQSKNILYFFGKVTDHTEKMIQEFRNIIGEFPVFDIVGGDPISLIERLVKATSSSITLAVSLTSTIGSDSKDIYSLQRKKLEMNSNEPDWKNLPSQEGVIMWYHIPQDPNKLKDPKYFNKSELFSKSFTFKIATQPFSAGVEKCAYYALDSKNNSMVIKEYHRVGKTNPFEKYLEAIEISTVASFLSRKFNLITKRAKIPKINFLNVSLLRTGTVDLHTRYYTIEPRLQNSKYKRFNANTGIITELHHTLEAFAHFTYEYTKGYLVVYDLQGIELDGEFLLTDPAIHCVDTLRFGRTNFGKEGINQCFLENHKCNEICEKLRLGDSGSKFKLNTKRLNFFMRCY